MTASASAIVDSASASFAVATRTSAAVVPVIPTIALPSAHSARFRHDVTKTPPRLSALPDCAIRSTFEDKGSCPARADRLKPLVGYRRHTKERMTVLAARPRVDGSGRIFGSGGLPASHATRGR